MAIDLRICLPKVPTSSRNRSIGMKKSLNIEDQVKMKHSILLRPDHIGERFSFFFLFLFSFSESVESVSSSARVWTKKVHVPYLPGT